MAMAIDKGASQPHHERKRVLLSMVVIIAAAPLFIYLSIRLTGQIQWEQARKALTQKKFESAIQKILKANQRLPRNHEILITMGRIYLEASSVEPPKTALALASKAQKKFQNAVELNPHDVEAVFGLAEAEARLETLALLNGIMPSEHNFNAEPIYQEVLRLRPNGIYYHWRFIDYLYAKDKDEAMLPLVENLVCIYPPAVNKLMTKHLWSAECREAARKGLNLALAGGRQAKVALVGMSDLAADEKNWLDAAAFLKEALKYKKTKPAFYEYYQLGRLLINSMQYKEARTAFLEAMSIAQDKTTCFQWTLSQWRKTENVGLLVNYYNDAETLFHLTSVDRINYAKTLFFLKAYTIALKILEKNNQEHPSAEGFYWIARIHDKSEDWDAMEIASQKATVLAPTNSDYHYLFSHVLAIKNKLEHAESEASRAIESAREPTATQYSLRARIRWRRENYRGALDDWEVASSLDPTRAEYYAWKGTVHEKLGDWTAVAESYEKAIELDPENHYYQSQYSNAMKLVGRKP